MRRVLRLPSPKHNTMTATTTTTTRRRRRPQRQHDDGPRHANKTATFTLQGPVTSSAMHYQANTLTLQTQYVEALVVWMRVSVVVVW